MFLMPSQYEPCGLNQIVQLALWDGADRPSDRRPCRFVRHFDPRPARVRVCKFQTIRCAGGRGALYHPRLVRAPGELHR